MKAWFIVELVTCMFFTAEYAVGDRLMGAKESWTGCLKLLKERCQTKPPLANLFNMRYFSGQVLLSTRLNT